MNHVVGISEMIITDGPQDVLVTYSLGSCIGLSAYDPVAKVGGLIHCMLPLSQLDPEKARQKPAMFIDTGVSALLQALVDRGAQSSRLVVKVAGGAHLLDDKRIFNIGERNYTVLRKMLWKNSILISGEDVGGSHARTLYLVMAGGRTILKAGGKQVDL